MRLIKRTSQFKRDAKKVVKRGWGTTKLKSIIESLEESKKLPVKNKDHSLKGTLKDCRECHIEPDWLLIYRIDGSDLWLIRTGSHSDLFNK